MIQIGTATSAGSWIKLTAIGAATASKPSAAATISDGDQRPTTNARSELEHQRPSSSRRCAARGRRDDDRDRHCAERHAGDMGPHAEGDDGHGDESEVSCGRRVGEGGDDGDREGEDRDQAAELIGLEPPLTRHSSHGADCTSPFRAPTSSCGWSRDLRPRAERSARGLRRGRCLLTERRLTEIGARVENASA